ncbi:hypothetical protein [Pectobacterium parmentieri]|uniref:hypothetical protein n=1 Tax=Pectobacterium parmentieri TaxID=1905730 RepID=UPI000D610099|nr:hypothetical protein [Pectobacterium parmentieri]PWD66543.1 hypothetical protein DF211_01970 [Pectobacterium parmentieri]
MTDLLSKERPEEIVAGNNGTVGQISIASRRMVAELLQRREAAKEPVAYIVQDKYERESGKAGYLSYSPASKYISDADINEHGITCTPLFTAPPLPVVQDSGVTAEHRRVIGMLLNACGAAFELADDTCQQVKQTRE